MYKRLQDPDNGAPLANRATQGLYPTGSTFKLITSTAALESGLITPSTVLFDGGSLTVGGVTFKNAGGASLRRARAAARAAGLLGRVLLPRRPDGRPARRRRRSRSGPGGSGSGGPTGIDLPGRGAAASCRRPSGATACSGANLTDRPWTPGDNINLAVGQGDLQANPLQMAVAYSAIANGGRIVTPHVGLRVEDNDGRVLQKIEPGARRSARHLGRPRGRRSCRGCAPRRTTRAARRPAVFEGFPITVAGKTGTAERGAQGDQSWYVAAAPANDPRIVVAVTIERGGFGAEAAAPAARRILAAYFGIKGKKAVGEAGSAPD